ncbi:CBS domain-containing protein [Halorussus pelagicus]|uniref:CBS domain-containing protein n=1 Tax=Halorussus pelagicus TaxID=2505977 RepID=UPI000FFBAACF|nr:CBS domain-containing protein [Halorussus pelagicus]
MTVEDIARDDVVTTRANASIADVAVTMREENVGSVVVTEDDQPTGIVTDRDVALQVVADDKSDLTAADVMTTDPATIPGRAGVFELTDAMRSAEVRRMPVVDDDGNLAGIVALDDLNRLLVNELDNLADVIESESPSY